MMKADFHIGVEAANDFIAVTIGGFFSESDVGRFSVAFDRALDQLDCGPNEHCTLIDMRGMQIQPQASVGAFRSVLNDPRKHSKRLAFVVAASLARMQIKRAAEGRDARYFTDRAEARLWLLHGDEGEGAGSVADAADSPPSG